MGQDELSSKLSLIMLFNGILLIYKNN